MACWRQRELVAPSRWRIPQHGTVCASQQTMSTSASCSSWCMVCFPIRLRAFFVAFHVVCPYLLRAPRACVMRLIARFFVWCREGGASKEVVEFVFVLVPLVAARCAFLGVSSLFAAGPQHPPCVWRGPMALALEPRKNHWCCVDVCGGVRDLIVLFLFWSGVRFSPGFAAYPGCVESVVSFPTILNPL